MNVQEDTGFPVGEPAESLQAQDAAPLATGPKPRRTRKPAKAKKAKPVALDAAPTAKRVRGSTVFPKEAAITVAADNPKRPGSKSAERFALYERFATVGDFIAAGGTYGDLRWDAARGYVAVEGYTPPKPFEPKPRGRPVKAESEVAV